MLTLYGSTNLLSPNTLKLRVALAETGADHELVPVDLAKGEQRRAEFLAKNPHGKIPVLSDDGFLLAESNAILFYLAERFPAARLLPAEPQGRARALQCCDFASMHLYTPYYELYGHTASNAPDKRIAFVADRARENLERSLGVLEALAGGYEWLASAFSIGDIACASVVRSIRDRLPAYADLRPATAAWYARVTARPAWQRCTG